MLFHRNDFLLRASDNIQEFTLTQEKSATILVQEEFFYFFVTKTMNSEHEWRRKCIVLIL